MRLKYIDAVKGFGMLFIMWGHIINFNEYASWWGSSFKVAVFYTLSGYLMSIRSEDGITAPKTPLKKLVASLGVPYAFYSALSLIAALCLFLAGSVTAEELTDKLIATFTLGGISTLWFLPSMFIGRALFDLTYSRKTLRILRMIFLAVAPFILCLMSVKYKELTASSLLSQGVNSILLVVLKGITALWFISVGFEGGKLEGKIKESYRLVLSLCAVAIASVLTFSNRAIDLNKGDFGVKPIMFFVTGTLFSLGLTGLFRFFGKRLSFPVTGFIGRNSLFIMATHLPLYIVPAVALVVDRLIPLSATTAGGYIRGVLILVAVLLIEWVLILIKNKAVAFLSDRLKGDGVKRLLRYV